MCKLNQLKIGSFTNIVLRYPCSGVGLNKETVLVVASTAVAKDLLYRCNELRDLRK